MNFSRKHITLGVFCLLCVSAVLPYIECMVHLQCHTHDDEPAQRAVTASGITSFRSLASLAGPTGPSGTNSS